MSDIGAAVTGREPLAIICGGGSLPYAVAEAAIRRGRRVILLALAGSADPAAVEAYPHHWIVLGQFGRFRRLLASAGCRDVVMIGGLMRPSLRRIKLDWATLRLVPRIVRAFRGGDDHLLSGVAAMFADAGLRIVGLRDVAPEILAPMGAVGKRQPSARDRADIEFGLAVLSAIGSFDVGQAAVVAGRRVLAVEAAEGTDLMLARIAELRQRGRLDGTDGIGVLVKAPKPTQDRRFDLPTIGPATVDAVARAGLAGIAVIAGATLIAELEAVIAAADRADVFVVGTAEQAPGTP
jgi:UDP-2,3-diacylglucosamine hydrolase